MKRVKHTHRHIISGIVALVAVAILGYVILSARPHVTPYSSTSQVTGNAQQKNVHEETSAYVVDVSYRTTGNVEVDSEIAGSVHTAVDNFKHDVATMGAPAPGAPKYSFKGEPADVYVGPDIISERINFYQDTGGAHGMPIVYGLNYNAKNDAPLTLDDALSLTGLSLKQIAEQSLAQLKKDFGEDSLFPAGAEAKPENYQTFVVGPYNVTFIFSAYQVVAYAAGMPEIKFARR
jgi:hypothetical protein